MDLRLFAVVLSLCCLSVCASGGGKSSSVEHPEAPQYDASVRLNAEGKPLTDGEIYCEDRMKHCHMEYAPHVRGDIAHAYTPEELDMLCEHKTFRNCMHEAYGNCSSYQRLMVESIEKGEKHICKSGNIKDYRKAKWEALGEHPMEIENDFCMEQFYPESQRYLMEFMHLDGLEEPDSVEDADELDEDIKDKKKKCCGYHYAYLDCMQTAVTEHGDSKLGDWQYALHSKFWTPQFEECGCKVGKGLTVAFRNGMIIVAGLFIFIIGLATSSGCAMCCGEKITKMKRRMRQFCYCCYAFEEDDEYFERKYEQKLEALYGGNDNEAFVNDRKSYAA